MTNHTLRRLGVMMIAALATLGMGASVKWLKTTHDFGAFKEDDGKVSCTFRFVNTGDEAVSIRAARASCGCTTPSFTKTPIEPGDTGVIHAAFNPIGRPGRFEKSLTVDISGAGAGPRQKLYVKGVVIGSSNTLRSRYPIEAGNLKLRSTQIPFGTVLKGKAKSAFLEVYNASQEPLVPRFINKPDYLRVAASMDTVPPGEQVVYSLVLTPTATSLYGILTDSMAITTGTDMEPLKLDITAILEEDFTTLTPAQRAKAPVAVLEGDRVNFEEFSGKESRSIELRNDGKSDLLVRRVYTTDPGVTVKVSGNKIKKGGKGTITVTADSSLLPSDLLNARIQIITNDPDNPISILRAVGKVKPQ